MTLYRVLEGAHAGNPNDRAPEPGTEFEWDGSEVDSEGDIVVKIGDRASWVLPEFVQPVLPASRVQVHTVEVKRSEITHVTINLTAAEVKALYSELRGASGPLFDLSTELGEIQEQLR